MIRHQKWAPRMSPAVQMLKSLLNRENLAAPTNDAYKDSIGIPLAYRVNQVFGSEIQDFQVREMRCAVVFLFKYQFGIFR